jgi:hypothetical protein
MEMALPLRADSDAAIPERQKFAATLVLSDGNLSILMASNQLRTVLALAP